MKINSIDVPAVVKKCLKVLVDRYSQILGNELLGMYVHGSIAMDCFNDQGSDIDVLVVVNEKLSIDLKKKLGQLHLNLSNVYKKNIELSVVTKNTLKIFTYPTPFEFHYSDDHKEAFSDGTIDFSEKKDHDLAAHFVITKKHGITLFGEPASEVFPNVSKHDYIDSISRDSDWSYQNIMRGKDEGECSVPKYAVLNFCRVLAFISDGIITSKKTGAEWAMKNTPTKFKPIIQQALSEYKETNSSEMIKCDSLKDFATYANQKIRTTKKTHRVN